MHSYIHIDTDIWTYMAGHNPAGCPAATREQSEAPPAWGTGGESKAWGDPPVHGELLGEKPPVISSGVGGIQAVADLLPDGEGDFEGIGSQLGGGGGGGATMVGAEGVKGAGVLQGEEQGKMLQHRMAPEQVALLSPPPPQRSPLPA